jgi:restriction system protein
MLKSERLYQLARKRQKARWPGYACVGDFHCGAYECDHVSPYTKSAGNEDSPIMVVLQDWSSEDRLRSTLDREAMELGHSPGLLTNRNLIALLDQHLNLNLGDVFATNLFPFVKPGGLSAAIPQADLVRAAGEFAIPQIKIVDPVIVICLGARVYDAIRKVQGLKLVNGMSERIKSPFSIGGSQVWCQSHTGALGTNNRNRSGVDRVNADWEGMAEEFRSRDAALER